MKWVLALFTIAAVSGCVGHLEELDPPSSRTPRLLDGGLADPFADAEPVYDDAALPGEPPPPPPPPPPPSLDAGPPPGPARIVWKAAIGAGDNSISAFDNARETIRGMFVGDGILPENIVQLSRSSRESGVRDMSVDALLNAMLELDVGEGDGCVVFLTSHGSPSGFYIEGRGELSPGDLASILDEACGDRPTVVMVSACYSGIFIDPVARPNRIVLTAARPDRTSFGCGSEETYTYWDSCVIEEFPRATTWTELYDTVTRCIEDKEAGFYTPSEPQASFGTDVRDLGIFDRM